MSKVVEYVGVFHIIKDNVKEAWTQFWANVSSSPDATNGGGGPCDADEREINFRTKVKEKLDRFKQRSIQIIDNSSNDQEDYSHLTRSKTRKELMQISAAVMGIEFSYAAETAFVSPLLLSIGLRHRHMTLIWCLSPLLGLFITPLLGSLSDGCRSQLGRRRPFIILLSIGIILGLILVPNGKTLGRMAGDKYDDDEPVDLKVHSEVASRLLVVPNFNDQTISSATSENQSEFSLLPPNTIELTSESSLRNSKWEWEYENSPTEEKLSYKKFDPTEYGQGFRASNSVNRKDLDLDREEYFKTLSKEDKSRKINQEEILRLVSQASQDADNEKEDDTQPDSSTEGETTKSTDTYVKVTNVSNEATKTLSGDHMLRSKRLETSAKESTAAGGFDSGNEDAVKSHPWGLLFTVIGTVLLDFDADACQSPSRAYMLDVTIPEDHAKGLSTFTIMAGLGGSIGYFLGALNWDSTFLGRLFGGHVRAVFTLVLFIFIACVVVTIRSFREIPIDRLWANKSGGGFNSTAATGPLEPKPKNNPNAAEKTYARLEDELEAASSGSQQTPIQKSYGTVQETSFNTTLPSAQDLPDLSSSTIEQVPQFREYVKTIVQLPRSLQWLCATNFFCWMSLVCYSLYFTDFVGEAVYGGDPSAPTGSSLRVKYDEGVRFGCWGMSLYSLSCSLYSLCIEALVNRFGARRVYIYGQLVYSVGMVLMAIARHPAGVIIFSWTAGIMYATLFTMPYLLVARYHAADTFDVDVDDLMEKPTQMRGLGTDVAIVSSMVFLAQITQALTLGTIVTAVGSTTAIVCAAAVFASCGALCATKVLYLDL